MNKIVNIELEYGYYIRFEESVTDDVVLTLMFRTEQNQSFHQQSPSILIPKEQRNNIAKLMELDNGRD